MRFDSVASDAEDRLPSPVLVLADKEGLHQVTPWRLISVAASLNAGALGTRRVFHTRNAFAKDDRILDRHGGILCLLTRRLDGEFATLKAV